VPEIGLEPVLPCGKRILSPLQPDELDYLHALADLLMRTGRNDEALAVADRIVELYPNAAIGHQLKEMLLR